MKRLALVLVLALVACEGPVGPAGPQGEAGLMGEAGPGTRWVHTGTVNSTGGASVELPAAAGTINDPPLLGCYVSDEGDTWLVVATDTYSDITCGIGESGGGLFAAIVGAPAFWFWRVVVVY